MDCSRCGFDFDEEVTPDCGYCGKRWDRPVRKRRRQRPIGGKRGRNSGTVNKAKSR